MLGQLYIWEVPTWEMVTWEITLGKMPFGKVPNTFLAYTLEKDLRTLVGYQVH